MCGGDSEVRKSKLCDINVNDFVSDFLRSQRFLVKLIFTGLKKRKKMHRVPIWCDTRLMNMPFRSKNQQQIEKSIYLNSSQEKSGENSSWRMKIIFLNFIPTSTEILQNVQKHYGMIVGKAFFSLSTLFTDKRHTFRKYLFFCFLLVSSKISI